MRTKRVGRFGLKSGVATAAIAIFASAVPAYAQQQTYSFDIPAQDLASALRAFARASRQQVTFDSKSVRGKRSATVKGSYSAQEALAILLSGSGLSVQNGRSGVFIIRPTQSAEIHTSSAARGPASSSGSGDGTETTDIVVTGTSLRGVEYQASPIYTYSRKDIEQSGATDVSGLLRIIPQNFSGGDYGTTPDGLQSDSGFRRYNGGGATSPNLRGLGEGATLTLVNGRRVAPASQSVVSDIGLIPLDMIERIDILPDGASAIYGADAVGGVVNVILRNDYKGTEVSVDGTTDDGANYKYGRAAASTGFGWSTGGFLLSGAISDQSPLLASKRSFSAALPALNTPGGYRETYLYPDQQQYSVYGALHQEITPWAKLSADLLFGHRDNYIVNFSPANTTSTDYDETRARSDELSTGATLDISLPRGFRWETQASYSRTVQREHDKFVYATSPELDEQIDTRSQLFSVMTKIDGDLLQLPSGPVKIAIGGEHRWEGYTFTQVENESPLGTQRISRRNDSFFGEINVPVLNSADRDYLTKLDLSGAVRYDHYSDFGGTTNFKLGARLELTPGFVLRSTYSTSFRAPDLGRELRTGEFLFNVDFPAPTESGTVPILYLTGTRPLVAETSNAVTVGLDIAPPPIPNLKLSMTWFRYDYTNKLGEVPYDSAVLFKLAQYKDVVTAITSTQQVTDLIQSVTSTGGQAFVDEPYSQYAYIVDYSYRNLASQVVSGIDLNASYSWTVGSTTISPSGSATLLLQDNRKISPSSAVIDALGIVAQQPKLRIRSSVSVSRSTWSFTAALNYTSDFINTNVVPEEPISDWLTVDMNAQFRPFGQRGPQVGVSINNIFNRNPPFVNDRPGRALGPYYDPSNANPLKRTFSLKLTQRF